MTLERTIQALLVGVLSISGTAAFAEAVAVEDPPGKLPYRVHCASCHGLEADGKGPVAEHLRDKPPDLTALASNAGGTFPRQNVYRAIDGRDEFPTHGTREMPVWGISSSP